MLLLVLDRMTLPYLYAISAAFGAADAFYVPASGAVIPSLVAEKQLAQANALIGVSEQAAMTAGPASAVSSSPPPAPSRRSPLTASHS